MISPTLSLLHSDLDQRRKFVLGYEIDQSSIEFSTRRTQVRTANPLLGENSLYLVSPQQVRHDELVNVGVS